MVEDLQLRGRVYVASKFEEKERTRLVHTRLRELGFTITRDWTYEDETGMEGQRLADYLTFCAESDITGVNDCDVLIILAHPKGLGSSTEMGMALAWNKKIIAVRHKEVHNIFFNLGRITMCDTDEEAVSYLDQNWPKV